MGSGQKLYIEARKLIPGGTQLLSKRPELFLPEQWPAYYSRSKGADVWDLDGKKYTDVSSSGISSCVLGFADPELEEAVIAAVKAGPMTTLNCPEEVELAELLIELHPWAEMVRYARSGGEIIWKGGMIYVSSALAGDCVAVEEDKQGQRQSGFSKRPCAS